MKTIQQYSYVICIKIFFFIFLLPSVDASILHTVLGIPTECLHKSAIHQCKLSFSCWLQGGIHANGCGSNKWLFSCCIIDNELLYNEISSQPLNIKKINKKNLQSLPKRTMLRRRDEENEILQQLNCGISKNFQNTIQKRIIGGRPAQFAEYPWQAHIRIGKFQCGGVLVAPMFIATAGHCIQQARLQDIAVYLGELDTQNSGVINEPISSEKHRAIKKIIHPKFQFRMTQPDRYDVGLLKISRSAGNSGHISPICLPGPHLDLTGKRGMIAGWGKTAANIGHSGTNILQTASVPIISAPECVKWHQSKHITIELFSEMFCAGHSDGHQDACLGDSGGPLIVRDRGRYTLIGIISAGFGCGVDHQPGIYHNIQKTAKWIREAIFRN